MGDSRDVWALIADFLNLEDLIDACEALPRFGPISPGRAVTYWRTRFSVGELEGAAIRRDLSSTIRLWGIYAHKCGTTSRTLRRHTRRYSHPLCECADSHLAALTHACLEGWLDKAQWLINHFNLSPQRCTHLFYKVCRAGHLDIARWLPQPLSKSGPSYKMCLRGGDYYSFRLACAHGHLDLAQWLAGKLRSFGLAAVTVRDSWAFVHACSDGHLDTVRWMACTFDLSRRGANYDLAMRRASAAHQMAVVYWLMERFEPNRIW